MKARLKRFLSLSLAIVIAITTLSHTLPVQAASAPVFYGDSYQFMFSPEWDTFGLCIDNLSKKAKVTATVDKPKLASVRWDKTRNTAWVSAKKPCTVKVTLNVVQNGKTYKHITTMKWVKYVNPLKSLKLGSTNYNTKYFNLNTQASMKKQSGSKKIVIKLKPGYTLDYLGFSRGGVYKNIRNGDKITFTRRGDDNTVLFIHYKDPAGNPGVLRLFAFDKNDYL